MNKINAARLAAYIDGEGTISIRPDKFNIRLSIVNTNKKLIKWILYITKVGVISTRKRPNRKLIYVWTASCREASIIIRQVKPYLIVKKKQALIALKLTAVLRPSKKGLPRSLTTKEKRVRLSLRKKILKLNK